MKLDVEMVWLFGGVLGLLLVSSIVGFILSRCVKSEEGRRVVQNLNARILAWWVMCGVFAAALATGRIGSVLLFAAVSFLALREVIMVIPTRRSDHLGLFAAFFVILPFQYYLLYAQWYGMFIIFIPVYMFLFMPVRALLAGDYTHFLERTAKVHWGLMVCVYCVSYAPALLMLKIPEMEASGPKLLFFLVAVVQMSDVCQYVWGKLLGRRKIAPEISPNKTVEGLVGGVLTASLIGMGLWWITPFSMSEALGVSAVICLMGFKGGLTMSAIKRDAGIKDYSSIIHGHGGMLDRIDSLCFAAPIFFHYVRYFYTA